MECPSRKCLAPGISLPSLLATVYGGIKALTRLDMVVVRRQPEEMSTWFEEVVKSDVRIEETE